MKNKISKTDKVVKFPTIVHKVKEPTNEAEILLETKWQFLEAFADKDGIDKRFIFERKGNPHINLIFKSFDKVQGEKSTFKILLGNVNAVKKTWSTNVPIKPTREDFEFIHRTFAACLRALLS